jgi:hypothetical protein
MFLTIQSCSVIQLNESVSHYYFYKNNVKIYPKNISFISSLDNDKLVLASDDTLFIIQNYNLISQFPFKNITSVSVMNNIYYIGTQYGFYKLEENKFVNKLEIPAISTSPKITALLKVENEIWIGTEGVGIYKYDGVSLIPVPSTPIINCLAVTSDKSVWAGTNSGLFRFFADGSSVRYSEEIPHDGIAILDNDVRHLQVDLQNNLWVLMVNAVSVFTQEQFIGKSSDHVDPITFDYIGDDKNSVIKIYDLKSKKDKIVFSENGIYILSGIENIEDHNHDDNSDIKSEGTLKKIDFLKLADGKIIKIDKTLDCHYDIRNSLLISTLNGVYCIPKSVINKL